MRLLSQAGRPGRLRSRSMTIHSKDGQGGRHARLAAFKVANRRMAQFVTRRRHQRHDGFARMPIVAFDYVASAQWSQLCKLRMIARRAI
ncbi:hypothetical protein CBOM_07906 [Ceraceosorus bombacis]|uniref:Uncharacterized protein n=1 Tax=Ceraceosorus bombacis TaxID=401625 RepID=A0A0P1BQP6_9BASI|nr:hypothetical protein CBOM_07906 [Ceraceosorus bombacis]